MWLGEDVEELKEKDQETDEIRVTFIPDLLI